MKFDLEAAEREILDTPPQSAPDADDAPDMGETLKDVAGGAEGILADAGIVFTDGADFMKKKLTSPKWIIRDFIAVGMKGDLVGKSKTKKTYLGQQCAISIATGRNFIDARYRIDEPHVVAYINLELFDWNFQERMTAQMSDPSTDEETGKVCGGLGINPESLRGKLLICNLRGKASVLRDYIDALVEYLISKGVEMVFIDPLYKLLKPGEDMNSVEGMNEILKLRDTLALHFAVCIVMHDPKGETAQKSKTDRSAGSFVTGADFDFRLIIDLAEGWKDDNLVYVIDSEGRARKTPPAVGVRFHEDAQLFRADEDVAALKLDNRLGSKMNAETRAVKESGLQTAYQLAALKVVGDAGDNLLDTETFDNLVAKVKGAALGVNRRASMRKSLVAQGILATCAEKERKPKTGQVGNKKNGSTFVSTPERIAAYLEKWESLDL